MLKKIVLQPPSRVQTLTTMSRKTTIKDFSTTPSSINKNSWAQGQQ